MTEPARRQLRFAWVGPLTFLVHGLGAHADRIGMWGDDALYLSMAESLTRGGPLVSAALPGAPGVAKYPALWPAFVAALQQLGVSLEGVLWVNAALWALAVQLVVSGLLPLLGASWRVQLATGLVLAVDTLTMDLVPQLMSEPVFTLALVAAVVLVVRDAGKPRELAALAMVTAVAAGTRNVGGLYALSGGILALALRRWGIGAALLAGWAAAAVALRIERSWATLPTGDTLALLRYYVSYDVHTGWYADRWAEGGPAALLRGLARIVTANLAFGPKSLGLYLAPTAWGDTASDAAPGPGTTTIGVVVVVAALLGATRARRGRPIAALVLIHVAVFLAWTWPFSSRFWLPLFPFVVALAALALDGLGNVGRLLVVPVAGLVAALNGIQPAYAARAALWSSGPEAAAQTTEEDLALQAGIAALEARVGPGDILVGESYVFWLARPLGASALELRNLVPFDDALRAGFRFEPDPGDDERLSMEFARSLDRLRGLTPAGGTVWIVHEPRRREPKREWIRRATEAGLLRFEGDFGLLRVLTVSDAPRAN